MPRIATLRALYDLPRDTCVVTASRPVAEMARHAGRRAVLVGERHPAISSVTSPQELQANWSALSGRNPCVAAFGPPELAALVGQLSQTTRGNNETGSRRSQTWVRHLLRNVHHLVTRPLGIPVEPPFSGVPGFIVGAGPSLDREQPSTLAEMQRRGIVIRVNAGVSAVPGQCSLTIESHDLRAKMPASRSVRLFSTVTHPSMMHGALAPIYAGELSATVESLCGRPRLASSGSGTTAALSLAERWGLDPIILVGQDLGFPGGQVYAQATGFGGDRYDPTTGQLTWSEASATLSRPNNPLPTELPSATVPAWPSGTVTQPVTLAYVSSWLESAAEDMDAACINTSAGGVQLKHWAHIPLEDVLGGTAERAIEPREIIAALGEPALTDARLEHWLRNEAHAMLLEPWSHERALALLGEWRAGRQSKFRCVEDYRVSRFERELNRLVGQCGLELTTELESGAF